MVLTCMGAILGVLLSIEVLFFSGMFHLPVSQDLLKFVALLTLLLLFDLEVALKTFTRDERLICISVNVSTVVLSPSMPS